MKDKPAFKIRFRDRLKAFRGSPLYIYGDQYSVDEPMVDKMGVPLNPKEVLVKKRKVSFLLGIGKEF